MKHTGTGLHWYKIEKRSKKLDWKRINSNCNKMGWMLKIVSVAEIANAELLIEAKGHKNLITDIKTNRSAKFSRFPEQINISEPRMKLDLTKRKKKIFHLFNGYKS